MIKKIFAILLLLLFAQTAFAGTYVKGYVKKDGTYVSPHYRKSPSKSKNKKYRPAKQNSTLKLPRMDAGMGF